MQNVVFQSILEAFYYRRRKPGGTSQSEDGPFQSSLEMPVKAGEMQTCPSPAPALNLLVGFV